MLRKNLKTRTHHRSAPGFTLVELMIAMVIVGALTTIIYGLFVRTSDSLTEVEALAQTLDRARFGLIHVRNDLQGAGSQATPNGATDPWVQPKGATGSNLQAIRVYDGWEGEEGGGIAGTSNPGSRFSGFVVVGAYDYPQSFLVRNVAGTESSTTMEIEDNERGLGRLLRVDPFDIQTQTGLEIDAARHAHLTQFIGDRVLRIMDGEGFFQFAQITGLNAGTRVLTVSGAQYRAPEQFSGLDPALESDVNIDVALLDAFWYRVRVDPQDERNFQLVRHRIDASILLNGAALNEANLDNNIKQTLIIADNVADFRVWFDCVDATGQFTTKPRETGWDIGDPGGGCVAPTGANPELARAAHIRLSLRTPRENPNRPHIRLTGLAPGFDVPGGPMVTFDVNPDVPGSASVVTVQTSVELTGLAMRGVL